LRRELDRAPGPNRFTALGRLLVALGKPLREGRPADDAMLRDLDSLDVERWLARVDGRAVAAELVLACRAALASSIDEGGARGVGAHLREARAGLSRRDRLESALAALERRESLGPPLSELGRVALRRLSKDLRTADRAAHSLARFLVGLNQERREKRDRLAPRWRARAWWWTLRADCDGLASLWSGDTFASAALHCADCARDVAVALRAEPPRRCATADELWDLEDGKLPPARLRWIEAHARSCETCSGALRALAPAPAPKHHDERRRRRAGQA
jgi:hypothetical protein